MIRWREVGIRPGRGPAKRTTNNPSPAHQSGHQGVLGAQISVGITMATQLPTQIHRIDHSWPSGLYIQM